MSATTDRSPPGAFILGCAGPRLAADERDFFAETRPWGFILFKRNCETSDEVRNLVAELRGAAGRSDAPILIDQEGGRVQRLQPPSWRPAPAAARFGELAKHDVGDAERACRLNARLLAAELSDLGIDVNCLPCLDLRQDDTHDAIGDRAFADDPGTVARLGRAAAEGLLAGGVLPVIKHIPGHGRAVVDSHFDLPVVDADIETLQETDFAPFRALTDLPIAMTGHVRFSAIDPAAPATTSAIVIGDVIRRHMGFDGLLLSDDISMQALAGDVGSRSTAALAAGCDIVLHCNADLAEMEHVALAAGRMADAASKRAQRALDQRRAPDFFDPEAALAELASLLAPLESVT